MLEARVEEPGWLLDADLVVALSGSYTTSKGDPVSIRLRVRNAAGNLVAVEDASVRLAAARQPASFGTRWVVEDVPAGSYTVQLKPTVFDLDDDTFRTVRFTAPVLTVEEWAKS